MNTYTVEVEATLIGTVEIEADSEAEALRFAVDHVYEDGERAITQTDARVEAIRVVPKA